jgi:hypothetical protein
VSTRLRKPIRRSPDLRARLGVEELESRWLPSVNVLTYHNDASRTGQNLNETILTPANVTVGTFGKLFADQVDGYVFAQPLYMSNLAIAGGVHNVVFVATQHDSVYAFDANQGGPPLWQVSLLQPGERTITPNDVGANDIPEIGITSTPVIDAASGTLYVVTVATTAPADDQADATNTFQRLHALDITTGAEQLGGPVTIQASVNGTGDGNDGQGHVPFDPSQQLQRPGLLLSGGVVYIAFGSHGDIDPYHGWIMGYDAATLSQVAVFNTTPNGSEGGIWQSGGGLAADDAGNIYLEVGNGSFDGTTPPGALPADADYGQAFLKLAVDPSTPTSPNPNGWGLTVTDFFVPYNFQDLNDQDLDIGSGGVVVLPDSMGFDDHPHLLLGGSKEGRIYLLDRDNLGRYDSTGDNVPVETDPGTILGVFDTPALFNQYFYYVGAFGDAASAFSIESGLTTQSRDRFGYPGATPSVSANGSNAGIVWVLDRGSAELRAYDATDLSNELYNSDQAGTQDQLGVVVRFTGPTVADGQVFVGTEGELVVYGLQRGGSPRPGPGRRFAVPAPRLPADADAPAMATAFQATVTGPSTDGAPAQASGVPLELTFASLAAASGFSTNTVDVGPVSTESQFQVMTAANATPLTPSRERVSADLEFQTTIQPVDLVFLQGLGQMYGAALSAGVEALA